MDEEPVGYLGGSVEDDDPYADPYADAGADPYADSGADPYADSGADPYADDEEVVGLLGGASGEPEELPALPGAAGDGYAASDFMEGEDAYADPYADPYADQGGDYDDPYALPPSQEDDYEGYDSTAMAEDDPSYFDSMGHDDGYGPGDVETQSAEDFTQYDDDSSPKTISQQDAESIIRRITTKRILPPDQEKGKSVTPRQLTPTGGGLRIWPILIAALLLGAGGVLSFKQEIAEAIPELAPLLGVELQSDTPIVVVPTEPKEEKLKRLMLEKVLNSEAKAFGIEAKEYKKLKREVEAVAKAEAGPGKTRRRPRSSDGDASPGGEGSSGEESSGEGSSEGSSEGGE